MSDRKNTIEEILSSFWQLRQRMFHPHHHLGHNFSITPAQMQVLFLVKEKNGIGVTEIATKSNVTNSAATQLVNELVENGFLTREVSADDRRVFKISLTQKIKTHMAKMKNERLKKMSVIFSNLSDDELETFLKLIEKMTKQSSHL